MVSVFNDLRLPFQALGVLLALALIFCVGWLAVETYQEAPEILAAVVTGLVAILSLILQRQHQQQLEDQQARSLEMGPAYERFIKVMYETLADSVKTKPTDQEVESVFNQLSQKLVLWGSPSALTAFAELRTGIEKGRSGVPNSLDTFLREMRDDLGRSNKKLETAPLLKALGV